MPELGGPYSKITSVLTNGEIWRQTEDTCEGGGRDQGNAPTSPGKVAGRRPEAGERPGAGPPSQPRTQTLPTPPPQASSLWNLEIIHFCIRPWGSVEAAQDINTWTRKRVTTNQPFLSCPALLLRLLLTACDFIVQVNGVFSAAWLLGGGPQCTCSIWHGENLELCGISRLENLNLSPHR